MKILITLFLLTAFIGCGTKGSSTKKSNPPGLPENLQMGTSSEQEVEQTLGEPAKVYTVENQADEAKMMAYQDNKTFKIESGVMKAFFRDPIKDEKYLQYWLQKWKDQSVKTEAIAGMKNVHGQSEYQMINQQDNTTIIYDKENGIVKRVMYYEK
jgi:hypothetical protein